MRRHNKGERRSRLQSAADDHTRNVQKHVGKLIRDGRNGRRLTQAEAAAVAGISRSEWSGLELGRRDSTLWILNRAAHAVGGKLKAYVEQTSAASAPRDAVHLKGQELILRTAARGGWTGLPEAQIDGDPGRTRYADVLLQRQRADVAREVALLELIDYFDDVGAPTRDWQRRLEAAERRQIARMRGDEHLPNVSGCWVIRATRRNRELLRDHASFFRARFPGSARQWLSALADDAAPMPADAAVIWISVSGDRLFAARFGQPG